MVACSGEFDWCAMMANMMETCSSRVVCLDWMSCWKDLIISLWIFVVFCGDCMVVLKCTTCRFICIALKIAFCISQSGIGGPLYLMMVSTSFWQ